MHHRFAFYSELQLFIPFISAKPCSLLFGELMIGDLQQLNISVISIVSTYVAYRLLIIYSLQRVRILIISSL